MKKQIDVTYEQLASLKDSGIEPLEDLLSLIHTFWCGSDKDRESNVRIGTISVYLDRGENLHFDFTTRFSLKNYPQYKQALKDMEVVQ